MSNIDVLQELEQDASPPPRRGLAVGAVVLLIGVALTVLVIGIRLVQQQQGRPMQGPAPDFTVTTFDGREFTLSEQRGSVVVINFWASWCGPCRAETPVYESLWNEYKDKGVIFLGLTFADDPGDAQEFMAQYGMTYLVADDGKSEISNGLYHIRGVPETFVIDKQGNIESFFYFLTDDTSQSADDLSFTKSQLARMIDSLLAES
jgi:cytochrome c biogenesis protein CcmG/thiol:disulfide interchange protein DsbE